MPNLAVRASATGLPAAKCLPTKIINAHRRAIMQAAHFTAKYRVATVGGSYRKWFVQALAYEWKRAKADRLRRESNVGLPLRSCLADGAPRLLTRASGRIAHSFAA